MIDRLGEINRVLLAIRALGATGPDDPIPLESLIALCRERVQQGLLPDHLLSVTFTEELGFLSLQDEIVRVTDQGIAFCEFNPEEFYELSQEQRLLLGRSHYLGGTHKSACRTVLSKFNLSQDQARLVWSELDDAAINEPIWIIDHLCQLGILQRLEGGYETTAQMSSAVIRFLEEPKGMTEEKLREMLAEKSAIGDIGEELIMSFERQRLVDGGAVVEAQCVRRIGNVRVNAGYDIDSFDGSSKTVVFDRHIEVKAAKSKELRFFWSENEMRVARELGDRYWIYFVGGVRVESRSATQQPLMFQNPLVSILENTDITKQSQGLIVEARIRGEKRA